LSDDGMTLAISTKTSDHSGWYDAGHVQVYTWNNGAWEQKGSDILGEPTNHYDIFGAALALSGDGNTLIVGSPNKQSKAGSVSVYNWKDGSWQKLGNDIMGEASNDENGRSVDINYDGTAIIMGARGSSSHGPFTGQARMYRWDGSSWVQMGDSLVGLGERNSFGFAVAMSADGETIGISGINNAADGNRKGYVWVFVWNEDEQTWEEVGDRIVGEQEKAKIGYYVSMDSEGSKVAIGSYVWETANGRAAGRVAVYSHEHLKTSEPDCQDPTTPYGGTHSVTRYSTDSVNAPASCVSETRTRTCNEGGVWGDYSGSFSYDTCYVYSMCGDTEHGAQISRVRYHEAEVNGPAQCIAETQYATCNDGNFGEWSGSGFQHDSCVVRAMCGDVQNGAYEYRIMYEEATVDYPLTCQSEQQSRLCNDGDFESWSGTYTNSHCSVAHPDCQDPPTPYGGSQSITRYSIDFVNAPETCESETRTRTCNAGGVWGEYSGSFTYETCYAYSMCGNTEHGDRINRIRYLDAEVNFPGVCVPETQYAVCNDGEFGEWSGSGFQYDTCVVRAMCGDIPHGSYEFRTMYEEEKVDYPLTCQSEEQSRLCHDGEFQSWDGTFTHSNCEVEACTFVCTDEFQEMSDEFQAMATRLESLESVVSTIIDNMRKAAVDLKGDNLSRRNLADNRLMKELESLGLLKA